MITESYPLDYTNDKLFFQFKSVGNKGVIEKVILFQKIGNNRYNLAFGDVTEIGLTDKVISNNGDLPKIISTVAQSVYIFFERYSEAVIEIKGVDKKRQRLYNYIFSRRILEIELLFDVYGEVNRKLELYKEGGAYEKFVIQRKNK